MGLCYFVTPQGQIGLPTTSSVQPKPA